MAKLYQSEAQLEEHLIGKLENIKYERIIIKDYDAMIDNFRVQVNKLNQEELIGNELSDTEFERFSIQLLKNNTVYKAASAFRQEQLLERDDGSKVYLKLLCKYPEDNIWQVSNQIRNEKWNVKNRYDVTILINGLPIVQIELKRNGVEINEAINQIDRYRLESFREFFKFINIFVVSNGNETKYFANTDSGNVLKALTFYWTDRANNRINNLDNFSDAFLSHYRLNKMLNKYTVLSEANKNIMVMRPYQIYAVELFIDRAKDTNRNGYVSHATGSGKTLTSFKLAKTLESEPSISKVFFLIDRKDLDYKTVEDFNSYEQGCIDATDSTKVLVNDIKNKHKKMIVTTIQKMSNAINRDYYKKAIEPYKDEHIIIILDECHRSVFGKMKADLDRFFTNVQYFGFTGTPRFKENCGPGEKTTEEIFDKPLHQYLMVNSIHDKNTLGFNIEYMSTYKDQYTDNDPINLYPEKAKEILESDARIETVANYIYRHHRQKTADGKYTAIFATSSIDMLVKYYDKLKEINKDNYLKIAATFSFATNEDGEDKDERHKEALIRIIKDYNDNTGDSYSLETYDTYQKNISKRLQHKSAPPPIDILIVVNQFLTGFDSKPTACLYIDKNLDTHNLIQAYSRTNRVYDKGKQFGNIVLFRDLKKQTDYALKLFNDGNSEGIIAKPYEFYEQLYQSGVFNLKEICPTVADVDNIMEEPEQIKFVKAFRALINTVNLLETYSEFTWENDGIKSKMDRQEFEDYKGRYRQIYEEVKLIKEAEAKENSESDISLEDIDFEIELIQKDRINVFYIINLLKSVRFENEEKKKQDIQFILEELARADNQDLRVKEDIYRRFIEEVVMNLTSADNIEELFLDFQSEIRDDEIVAFAKEHELNQEYIKELIAKYDFTHYLDSKKIRKRLADDGVTFLKINKALKDVEEFIILNNQRFGK